MTLRVNMMQEGEFRRQGAVSGAFIVRISIAAVLGFGLLIGGLAMARYRIERADLLASSEIWAMREPLYNKVQAMKHDVAFGRKLQQELAGWTAGRIEWHLPLLELQKITTNTVQIKRLSVRGDTEFLKGAPPPPAEGGEGEGGTAAKAAPAAGTPVRVYDISVEGISSGEKAEDTVFQYVRVLGRMESMQGRIVSNKLHSLQRDTSQGGEQTDRRFRIESKTAQIPMLAK